MTEHRVDTRWTTAVWTSMCLDCPWEIDGSHEEVTTAAAQHAAATAPMRKVRRA